MAEQKASLSKTEDEISKQLQLLAQTKKLVFGAEQVLKSLRKGFLKKVYLASNCPQQIQERVTHYASLGKVPVAVLRHNNEELGILCKKIFFIAAVGVRE